MVIIWTSINVTWCDCYTGWHNSVEGGTWQWRSVCGTGSNRTFCHHLSSFTVNFLRCSKSLSCASSSVARATGRRLRIGHWLDPSWIGLDWVGLDGIGLGWMTVAPFFKKKLVIIAAQLMLFLSNHDLWTFNYPGFIMIKSQHHCRTVVIVT